MVLISDVCGGFGVGVEEVIEGGSASNAQLLTLSIAWNHFGFGVL